MTKKRQAFLLLCTLPICFVPAGCSPRAPEPVDRSFPADHVTRVVLRAALVESATVAEGAAGAIEISGLPSGGAKGYHSPDSCWRETPADRWGLDFEAKRYGEVLVISSKNEIGFLHHAYLLTELRLTVPAGVEVVCEPRALGESGEPDLGDPGRVTRSEAGTERRPS